MNTSGYTLRLEKLDKLTNTITTISSAFLVGIAAVAMFFVTYMIATYNTIKITWVLIFIIPAILCFIALFIGYFSYNIRQQEIVDEFVRDVCTLYRQLTIEDTRGMAKKLLIENKKYDIGVINGYNYRLRIYNNILHVYIIYELEAPPYNPQMGQNQYQFE